MDHQAYWDARPARLDMPNPPDAAFLAYLRADFPFSTVAEIGVGAGVAFPMWEELRVELKYAVDFSPTRLDLARSEAERVGVTPEFHLTAASSLPFEDDAVDLAAALHVLMHMPFAEAVLTVKEMARVAEFQFHHTAILSPDNSPDTAPHCFFHDLEDLCREAGVRVLALRWVKETEPIERQRHLGYIGRAMFFLQREG